MPDLHLSHFELDASPPKGHPLCGGWIRPVEDQDDPLLLRGLILQGSGLPVVLAALDWTGVGNESHRIWVEALADAVRTTPDRVSLHCVHQHNAPFVDRTGNRLLREAKASPLLYDETFVDAIIAKSVDAASKALINAEPVDRIRAGQAKVKQVACNRRVIGPDGKIKYTRTSSTRDPNARAEPEGTIDPLLRSIGFLRGGRLLARVYFYTTHPMSYYGDGRVSADFVGLARARRDREQPDVKHLYFTGCAGNVTAGKYNDGSLAMRTILADRVHSAMKEADQASVEGGLDQIAWRSEPISFGPREDLDYSALAAIVADPKETTVNRNRSAMTCAWLKRLEQKRPILLGRLDLGPASILFLPGETFVEYQLFAQQLHPDRFLATAAYGDGGPWYIPLEKSYDEGGYEPSVSWVSRHSESPYRRTIEKLLGDAAS